MKIAFNFIFRQNPDGSITPTKTVNINGVTLANGAVSFGPGASFGGINIAKFVGHDFEVDESNGVYSIKGVY